MKTWWRKDLDGLTKNLYALRVPWLADNVPDNDDDWDCFNEQLWAIREGLA